MSLYLIIFIILGFSVIIEYYKAKTPEKLYILILSILILLLCFRYGQGSDYFGYYNNFLSTPCIRSLNSIIDLLNSEVHGEFGWLLICSIFRTLRVPFECLICIVALIDMFCLDRFIQKYCPQKILALFLSFPTLYLTYFFSALRQGIVIALFLGFFLEYLFEKKYIKYIIGVIICTFIHSMAIILLIIPIANYFKCTLSEYTCIAFLCFGFGAIISFTPMMHVTSYGNDTYSLISILERIISFIVVIYLGNKKYKSDKDKFTYLMRIYIYGIMLYGLLWSSSLVSSRICIPFKCAEIAIFSNLTNKEQKIRMLILIFCFLITTIMVIKNMQSYIVQGDYYNFVNVFNYPYVSIFNSDTIIEYKEIMYQLTDK